MNTNEMELSMNEMEMANGGMKFWESMHYLFMGVASGAVIGGALGAGIGGVVSSAGVLIKLYTEDD